MPTVNANGIDIRYEAYGGELAAGQRLVPVWQLVLTHGFAGPLDCWAAEVMPLADERMLIMYDVRGHGRSSVPAGEAEYSMPIFAADLAALLKTIGVERAHIGGVSMGGMVTAQFAVDYPEMCESVLICDSTCGNASDGGPGGDWERRMVQGFGMLTHMVSKYGLLEPTPRQEEGKRKNDPHYDVRPYD